ncbi:MAG: NUDIX domain-containing protein [Nitrososphaerales archaeon]
MFIDHELYKRIHELMPVPCVDLVIMKGNNILLLQRKHEPAKEQFWFPGGRIYRGESFAAAAKRIAKTEVSLDIDRFEQIGCGNLVFNTDPFGHGKGTHAITIVMKCHTNNNQEPRIDDNHSRFIWWGGTQGHHPYICHFASEARKTS